MKKPKKNRKFVKGTNQYTGWIIGVIIIVFILILVSTNKRGLEFEGNQQILWVALVALVVTVIVFFRRKVWVAQGSSVYHNKEGCCGANRQISLRSAKSKKLEPCAKCHKIENK